MRSCSFWLRKAFKYFLFFFRCRLLDDNINMSLDQGETFHMDAFRRMEKSLLPEFKISMQPQKFILEVNRKCRMKFEWVLIMPLISLERDAMRSKFYHESSFFFRCTRIIWFFKQQYRTTLKLYSGVFSWIFEKDCFPLSSARYTLT